MGSGLFPLLGGKMDDKILNVFRFGVIQDCLNIKRKLDKYDISWEEFEAWVTEKAKTYIPPSVVKEEHRIPNIPMSVLKRHCPECKGWLKLYEVNKTASTKVDKELKSQWFCRICGWEEFSTKDIVEEALPFVEELKVVYLPVDARTAKQARRKMEHKPCGGK